VGRNVGWITACYAAGAVCGTSEVGGLVGVNSWKITACYAIGAVGRTGKTIGGLVGKNDKGIVNGSFWNTQTTGQTISAGGTGMTTAQMKMLSYYKFAGWEGKGWVMQNNIDYPRLSWENTEGIAIPPAGFSCAGSGTPEDPYQLSTITDWQDLIANSDGWDSKCYILINDIDFGGINLFPIGMVTQGYPWEFQGIPFTGLLDGNGHVLSNLIIDESGKDGIGLFGYLCWGQIQNLGVENATITGRSYVGGLVAINEQGTIDSCYLTGTVRGVGEFIVIHGGPGDYIGGLVGENREGTITSCYSSATVNGHNAIGCLVGSNIGTITDCYAKGTASGNEVVGGLSGGNWEGTISDCFATGTVSGKVAIGGLVGSNEGTIIGCYATGTVSGELGIGGLVGGNNEGTITTCYATGTIRGNSGVGGLVGGNAQASISACYATGTINASEKAGGLVGWNSGTITDSFATCGINSSECFYGGVGGLCGDNSGTLSDCSTSGIISSTGNYVGGLAGKNRGGMITNCYTTGSTNGYYYVGGLVGKIESGSITSCSATGIVNGARDNVGGLIGYNDKGIITACYARGPVSGSGEVGGLAGYSYLGRITDCYANGTVSGKHYVGGLVGGNWDSVISTCYATGAVSGSGTDVGGLVAWNHLRTVTDCFWDIQTTGQNNSDGGKGLTTEQMKTLSIFQNAGWSGTCWIIQEGVDYPRLSWENTEGTSISAAIIPFAGSGTAEDPYRISTAVEFALLGWYSGILDKHILLTADMDLRGISLCPIGDYHGCSFTGLFDGGGHTLSNGGIHQPESEGIGLFGRVGPGGQIRNLGVENVNITGYLIVGGLVGWNEGTIATCSITGAIEGYDDIIGGLIGHNEGAITTCDFTGVVKGVGYYSSSIGGLVGRNQGSTITASHATGMVNGNSYVGGLVGVHSGSLLCNYSSSTVNGSGGGLVGTNGDFATITACYATGAVSSGGGLVGENRGAINACYATGAVSTGKGLVGYNNEERGTVTACFWDKQTTGQPASQGGTGKTMTEMKTRATFTDAGWDFVGESANGTTDVWRMCADGIDYPRLSWEFSQGGDMDCPDGVAMEDLLYLAGRWMAGTPATFGAADTNGDGKVDLSDFETLASNWMRM
jgi:hypothetical protein